MTQAAFLITVVGIYALPCFSSSPSPGLARPSTNKLKLFADPRVKPGGGESFDSRIQNRANFGLDPPLAPPQAACIESENGPKRSPQSDHRCAGIAGRAG